jgi:hypothetical protein
MYACTSEKAYQSSKNAHQRLRALAQSAVRTVLKLVMREE